MTVTARLHVEGIDVWVAQEFEVLDGGEVDPVGFAWLENDESLPMSVPEETVKWIMSRPVAPGAQADRQATDRPAAPAGQALSC